jgi:hypothetical protein
MKKLALVFSLLMPALLFGQQDTAKQTFKIGEPTAAIGGKSKGFVSKRALERAGKLMVVGLENAKITGFTLTIHYKWCTTCDTGKSPEPMVAKDEALTDKMIRFIKGASLPDKSIIRTLIIFSNIECTTSDGAIHKLPDISFILSGE